MQKSNTQHLFFNAVPKYFLFDRELFQKFHVMLLVSFGLLHIFFSTSKNVAICKKNLEHDMHTPCQRKQGKHHERRKRFKKRAGKT